MNTRACLARSRRESFFSSLEEKEAEEVLVEKKLPVELDERELDRECVDESEIVESGEMDLTEAGKLSTTGVYHVGAVISSASMVKRRSSSSRSSSRSCSANDLP